LLLLVVEVVDFLLAQAAAAVEQVVSARLLGLPLPQGLRSQ
jgi:hypothetical protein